MRPGNKQTTARFLLPNTVCKCKARLPMNCPMFDSVPPQSQEFKLLSDLASKHLFELVELYVPTGWNIAELTVEAVIEPPGNVTITNVKLANKVTGRSVANTPPVITSAAAILHAVFAIHHKPWKRLVLTIPYSKGKPSQRNFELTY